MKRFLYRILILVPVPLFMVWMNYTLDPGNLFGDDQYVRQMSYHLASGRNVWSMDNPNYDERLKQIYVMEYTDEPAEVLVLGSSRCKGIHAGLFKGRSFYNAGVSAGSIEDFIGIYQLFHEKGFAPKTLVMEISAWLLNQNSGYPDEIRLFSIMPAYRRGLERLGLPSAAPASEDFYGSSGTARAKLRKLVSPAYLQQSWNRLWALGKIPSQLTFKLTDEPVHGEFVLFSDGSWVNSEEHRIVPEVEVRTAGPKGLGDFARLESGRINEFETFVHQIQSDGVEVVFFLPPWPGRFYQRVVAQFGIVKEEEAYVRDFARKHGIDVIGAYNGEELGYKLSDFADTSHLRRSAVPRLFGH